MNLIVQWKQKSNQLKTELKALYLAYKHPNTPWYARVCMAVVLGYALSPIDLIPDFIPICGYLDELVIVPAGIYLTLKMIPKPIMLECREKALTVQLSTKAKWVMVGIIVAIWILLISLIVKYILQFFVKS